MALDSTPKRPALTQVDGRDLQNLFGAGGVWLERNVAVVNSLNVFPVPDGDTGTNMLLTMQAAVREARAVSSRSAGEVCAALSHGALLGARGNSGVILSQILRGFARALDHHETMDARLFADALVEASRTAYKGVVKPVEGTILTVIREAADRAVIAAAQTNNVAEVLEKTVESAYLAVQRTPQLLAVLKQAGVVDAGGQGLALILEGALRYADGQPLETTEPIHGAQRLEALGRPEGWGYDIQYHIRGKNLNVQEIRDTISAMGESALIVGDEMLVKVHVHAPNPGAILQYGADQGALVNIVIENMQEQYLAFRQGSTAERRNGAENLGVILPHAAAAATPPSLEHTAGIATIAVVPGEGLKRIFESLGIRAVVYGGPTMNPSAQDLLEAVQRAASEKVLLLPNDKNVILVANQVQELTPQAIRVIPTKTVPQGVAALLAFNAQQDLESNVRVMTSAMNRVRTVELTYAVRSAHIRGIDVQEGKPIALLDGELVAAGDALNSLLLRTLHLAGAEDSEIITLYYGSQVTLAAVQEVRALVSHEFPEQEVELHEGGQPLYPFIISVE